MEMVSTSPVATPVLGSRRATLIYTINPHGEKTNHDRGVISGIDDAVSPIARFHANTSGQTICGACKARRTFRSRSACFLKNEVCVEWTMREKQTKKGARRNLDGWKVTTESLRQHERWASWPLFVVIILLVEGMLCDGLCEKRPMIIIFATLDVWMTIWNQDLWGLF